MMAHEFFHYLQYVIGEWNPRYDVYVEGQASFAQTVAVPEVERHFDSIWYAPNAWTTPIDNPGSGANGFQDHPAYRRCDHKYSYSGYWGTMYRRNSGFDSLRAFLEEVASESGSGTCEHHVASAVGRALQRTGGNDPSDHSLTRAFTEATLARDFAWAGEDFGAHLRSVAKDPYHATTRTIPRSAVQFVALSTGGIFEVSCSSDPNLQHAVYTRVGASYSRTTLSCTGSSEATVDSRGADEAVFATFSYDREFTRSYAVQWQLT